MKHKEYQLDKFTHKGWFMFCPIYLRDIHTACPTLMARWCALNPLLSLCEFLSKTYISIRSLVDPHYEPFFAVTITGELNHER